MKMNIAYNINLRTNRIPSGMQSSVETKDTSPIPASHRDATLPLKTVASPRDTVGGGRCFSTERYNPTDCGVARSSRIYEL
jgi:hypothetical protein